MERIVNGGLQGKLYKRFVSTYANKAIWSYSLRVFVDSNLHTLATASFYDTVGDPTNSFLNERAALHLIKTTAISLNVVVLNLDEFEPRCHACTSYVLSEEIEGEFVCLTCGESGPRDWFFTGGLSNG
jgi:hypothetical protein